MIIQDMALYAPERVVTNQDLLAMGVPGPLEALKKWGNERRHFAADHENVATMSAKVIHALQRRGSLTEEGVDVFIVVSSTSGILYPNTALTAALETNLQCGMAYDLVAAGTSFLIAMEQAQMYLSQGAKKVLVIASDLQSTRIPFERQDLAPLFGDAAAGILFQASAEPAFKKMSRVTQLSPSSIVIYDHKPAVPGGPVGKLFPMPMPDGEKRLTSAWPVLTVEACQRALTEAGLQSIDDVDFVVSHQSAVALAEHVRGLLKCPKEKFLTSVEEYGNTCNVTIPSALVLAHQAKRLQKGQKILFAAVGVGMLSMSTVFHYR